MPVFQNQSTHQSGFRRHFSRLFKLSLGLGLLGWSTFLSAAEVDNRQKNDGQWSIVIAPGISSKTGELPAETVTRFDVNAVMQSKKVQKKPDSKSKQPGIIITPGPVANSSSANLVPPAVSSDAAESDNKSEKSQKNKSVGQAGIDPADYVVAYNSVPFSRAEYDANPSYRHDAAMEMLTGQLRTKIVNQYPAPDPEPFVDPILNGTFLLPFSDPYYLQGYFPSRLCQRPYLPYARRPGSYNSGFGCSYGFGGSTLPYCPQPLSACPPASYSW